MALPAPPYRPVAADRAALTRDMPMQAFAPRPLRFRGVLEHDGWRLKRYAISAGAPADVLAPEWPGWAGGRSLALAALPSPARTEARPGVGLLIEHRGAGADYLVLGWWDRENELPVRVVVRDQVAGAAWRAAGPTESFCVWDLEVMGFERDAYVATVLAPDADADALEAYLGRTIGAIAPPPAPVAGVPVSR